MIRYVLITCTISYLIVFTFGGVFIKGKTKVDFENTSNCYGEDPTTPLYITLEKCNKTHKCVTVNFTLTETIGPKSSIQISARKWTNNGGWINNAFTIKLNDACKNIGKLLGKNWHNIEKKMGMTCPVKPGTYVLDKYFIDFGDLPIAFMVGKYEIKGRLINKNKLIMCKTFTATMAS